jgi:hypothetical protein
MLQYLIPSLWGIVLLAAVSGSESRFCGLTRACTVAIGVHFIVKICNDGPKMKTKSNNANGMLKYRLSGNPVEIRIGSLSTSLQGLSLATPT